MLDLRSVDGFGASAATTLALTRRRAVGDVERERLLPLRDDDKHGAPPPVHQRLIEDGRASPASHENPGSLAKLGEQEEEDEGIYSGIPYAEAEGRFSYGQGGTFVSHLPCRVTLSNIALLANDVPHLANAIHPSTSMTDHLHRSSTKRKPMRRNSNFDLGASVDAGVHSTTTFHSGGVEETKEEDHVQDHNGLQQDDTEQQEERQDKRPTLHKVLDMVSSPSTADLNLELSGDIEMVARFVPTVLVRHYLDKAGRDSKSDVRPSKCQL